MRAKATKRSSRVGFCGGEPEGDGAEGAATVSDMVGELNPWLAPDQTFCRNCPYEPATDLGFTCDRRLKMLQAGPAALRAAGPAPAYLVTPAPSLFFPQPFTPIFGMLAQAGYGDKWLS